MKKQRFIWGLFLLCSPSFGQLAYERVPDRPNPARAVVDLTHTLNASQQAQLIDTLTGFFQRTSNQLILVIVPTVQPYAISDYALTIGRKWGIGNHGANKGVVLLWAKADRRVFISSAQGVEGDLPDALAHRVIYTSIVPALVKGQYYSGLQAGCLQLIALLDKPALDGRNTPSFGKKPVHKGLPIETVLLAGFLLLLLVVCLLYIWAEKKREKAKWDRYALDYQDYQKLQYTAQPATTRRPQPSTTATRQTPIVYSTEDKSPTDYMENTTFPSTDIERSLTQPSPEREPDRFDYGNSSDDTFTGAGSEGSY